MAAAVPSVQQPAGRARLCATLRIRFQIIRVARVELVCAEWNELIDVGKLSPPRRTGQGAVVRLEIIRLHEAQAFAIFEQDAPANIAVSDIKSNPVASERTEIGALGCPAPLARGSVDCGPLLCILKVFGCQGNPCERFHRQKTLFGRLAEKFK